VIVFRRSLREKRPVAASSTPCSTEERAIAWFNAPERSAARGQPVAAAPDLANRYRVRIETVLLTVAVVIFIESARLVWKLDIANPTAYLLAAVSIAAFRDRLGCIVSVAIGIPYTWLHLSEPEVLFHYSVPNLVHAMVFTAVLPIVAALLTSLHRRDLLVLRDLAERERIELLERWLRGPADGGPEAPAPSVESGPPVLVPSDLKA
jgi:hypothetical protein